MGVSRLEHDRRTTSRGDLGRASQSFIRKKQASHWPDAQFVRYTKHHFQRD
jgi:hypothetical protein